MMSDILFLDGILIQNIHCQKKNINRKSQKNLKLHFIKGACYNVHSKTLNLAPGTESSKKWKKMNY